jgi:hypothetical protein
MKNDRDAETPLEVLTDIREEMESRGYFHMTNGTDIAALLDELYKLRPLRYAEQEYKHGVLYVWDAVHQTFFEVGPSSVSVGEITVLDPATVEGTHLMSKDGPSDGW